MYLKLFLSNYSKNHPLIVERKSWSPCDSLVCLHFGLPCPKLIPSQGQHDSSWSWSISPLTTGNVMSPLCETNSFRSRVNMYFALICPLCLRYWEPRHLQEIVYVSVSQERDAVSKYHKVCSRAEGTLTWLITCCHRFSSRWWERSLKCNSVKCCEELFQ